MINLFRSSRLLLGALEVGDYSTTDTNEIIRCNRKVVIPRSRSGPHEIIYAVILQQIGVDKNSQLSAVTKGRHATVGFENFSIV